MRILIPEELYISDLDRKRSDKRKGFSREINELKEYRECGIIDLKPIESFGAETSYEKDVQLIRLAKRHSAILLTKDRNQAAVASASVRTIFVEG